MKKKIKFSIIIPVKSLNLYLEESIPKILALNYSHYEIIILPNDKENIIPPCLKNSRIKIIPTGKVSPAIKRDIGAKKANGDYLAFIDDDAYPRRDWLNIAEKLIREKHEIICGPAVTPENDSTTQKASGLFFETFLGGGNLSYRYKKAKKDFYVEDYPSVNFIIKKTVFFKVGGFKNKFWPGEDTKFCLDLIKRGYKILYSKDLLVYHHRRSLFLPHLKQIGSYGKHRGYFARVFPETSFKLTYFMPSIFTLGNIFLLGLSFLSSIFLKIWAGLLLIYFLLLLIDVFLRTSKFNVALLTIITIFLSHLTYGFAFIFGFFSRRFKSKLR